MYNWILMCFISGGIALQAIVNGRLGQLLANPFLAAFSSFAIGTVVLGGITFIHSGGIPKIPTGVQIPGYLWSGGLLGCVYVTAVLYFVPKMGPANLLVAGVVGQLLTGIIVDHFGLLNMPVHPISLTRLAGVGILVLGTLMIQNG